MTNPTNSIIATGVDLGSSEFRMTYSDDGQAKEISMPAVAGSDGKNLIVGKEALQQAAIIPDHFVVNPKQLEFTASENELMNNKHKLPYKLVVGKDERLRVDLPCNGKVISYYPGGFIGSILREMKKESQGPSGKKTPITDAVISVPDYATELQKNHVHCSGMSAGFNTKVMEESVLAVTYHGLDEDDAVKNTAVVHLGQTLTASIVSKNEGELIIADCFHEDNACANLIHKDFVKRHAPELNELYGVNILEYDKPNYIAPDAKSVMDDKKRKEYLVDKSFPDSNMVRRKHQLRRLIFNGVNGALPLLVEGKTATIEVNFEDKVFSQTISREYYKKFRKVIVNQVNKLFKDTVPARKFLKSDTDALVLLGGLAHDRKLVDMVGDSLNAIRKKMPPTDFPEKVVMKGAYALADAITEGGRISIPRPTTARRRKPDSSSPVVRVKRELPTNEELCFIKRKRFVRTALVVKKRSGY
ncbi:hypothetical protein DIURU_000435 [Diutina rugosa]|uniref:Uncharacterized protein n=1 Tax=Diutina rugosa TaxID=5481 RepID=A0A642UYD4_DIURU|nr:uncharacterized protein DIURU_000435 [Diutina rugosa]KAA8907748.1 hypothetical protein DIURU_000435 [Diutina rugosa]